jgi:hypothetical protein
VYHVELRQFPHNFCHFNMTEDELRGMVLDGWARGDWIELGERKWNPAQAQLKVLEGPRIPVAQLSMGRGWSSARRHGEDVTERMVASARAAVSLVDGAAASQGASSAGASIAAQERHASHAADSLGLEVLARLSPEGTPVALAWRLARERYPEQRASDCLMLAEDAIRSLIAARLIVVLVGEHGDGASVCEPGVQLERALLEIGCWSGEAGRASVLMRRA